MGMMDRERQRALRKEIIKQRSESSHKNSSLKRNPKYSNRSKRSNEDVNLNVVFDDIRQIYHKHKSKPYPSSILHIDDQTTFLPDSTKNSIAFSNRPQEVIITSDEKAAEDNRIYNKVMKHK